MSEDVRLMKGNEALAMAAIRCGADAYFGYPITPQSEVLETLMAERPWASTGMTVMQVESEVSAIHMVYGAAATGRMAMTSSSGPGISLMQGGISYMCGANLPCLVVNVMRGGPGLGTIQPSQGDYYQAVRGGGHGDYHVFTLAPASVQEMADFVSMAFDWAFKYRNPAMILADGTIGQMMEKVVLPPFRPRLTAKEVEERAPWAANGTMRHRMAKNRVTSLELDPQLMEDKNQDRENRYAQAELECCRHEETLTEDADIVLVAFGSSARVCSKAVEMGRAEGMRLGLIRPITLWPFPKKAIASAAGHAKAMLVVELNAGQMIDDVRLAVNGRIPVEHFGRLGSGVILTPTEIVDACRKMAKEQNL